MQNSHFFASLIAKKIVVVSPLLLLLNVFGIASAQVNAAQAVVHDEKASAASLWHFEETFGTLAHQNKMAFIAEGVPYASTLTGKETEAVKTALALPADKSEEAVKAIAGVFDYDAVRFGSNTYLLRKRYSNPRDLPYISFAEAQRSLNGILKATADLYPARFPHIPHGASSGSPLDRLFHTVSDEQRQALADPKGFSSLANDTSTTRVGVGDWVRVPMRIGVDRHRTSGARYGNHAESPFRFLLD